MTREQHSSALQVLTEADIEFFRKTGAGITDAQCQCLCDLALLALRAAPPSSESPYIGTKPKDRAAVDAAISALNDTQRSALRSEYVRRANETAKAVAHSQQMERDFLEKKVLNDHANKAMNEARLAKSLFSMWLFDHHAELFALSETAQPTRKQRRCGDQVTPMATLLRAWAHNESGKQKTDAPGPNPYLIELLLDAADEHDTALRADGGTAKVPEGWKLVPVEPTAAYMAVASKYAAQVIAPATEIAATFWEMVVTAHPYPFDYEGAKIAMLSAAPSPNGDEETEGKGAERGR